MQTPLEIAFQGMDTSPAVEAAIRSRVEKLEHHCDRITSCHVFVDAPHHHHQQGNRFQVRIEVRVPGTELAVNRTPGDVRAHEDVYVALRDAFDAMERQLAAWKNKSSGRT
jgi:ribosomal subunit interface protein